MIDLKAFLELVASYGLSIVGGVVLIGGGFTAIKEIRTNGWQPFKDRFINPRATRRKRLDELLESQTQIKATLETISYQLHTNGGDSVKDLVIKINDRLSRIHAKLRHQLDTTTTAIFQLDHTGGMIYTNRALCDMLDSDQSELLHRDYVAKVYYEDRTRFLAELAEALNNKMPLDSRVRIRKNSLLVTVQVSATPDVESGGRLMGFNGTVTIIPMV